MINLHDDAVSKMLVALGLMTMAVWWGRLMWHAEEVRAGRRRFWSRDLLLDVPVVAGMSLLTWGASEYLALAPGASSAVGVALGWLGPRGLRAGIEWWVRNRPSPRL